MKSLALATIGLTLCSMGFATPPTAQSIVQSAELKAAQQHKNVLVMFHASWCPWCRRLETLLKEPNLGSKLQSGYVIASIDIRERGAQAKNENPGWENEMRTLRGAQDLDVPYLAILSSTGEKLSDSYRIGAGPIPDNAGFPRSRDEIDAFVEMIANTDSDFTATDRNDLTTYFVKQEQDYQAARSKQTGHK